MKKHWYVLGASAIVAGTLSTAFLTQEQPAEAADHTDPAGVVNAGDAVDISDFYAWHDSADNTLTLVLTYAGPQPAAADQTAVYDADVLYGIHLDNDGDNVDDIDIWARFGQNDLGEWGVQVTGLPGEAGPVTGAVETEVTGDGGAKVRAGLHDDPFFMDFGGFGTTLANLMEVNDDADLQFDNTADFFATQNVSAIVIEVPLTAAQGGGGGTSLGMWASTSMLPGGN